MNSSTKINPKTLIRRPSWGSKWLPGIPFIFAGFVVADLVLIHYRPRMLPTQPPPSKPKINNSLPLPGSSHYQPILTRNIFSSDGIIPEALRAKGDTGEKKEEAPVPSNLPLALVGTLVHSNPEKSIAAIEVKSKNQVLSFSVKKEIETLATIEKIERGKVILRNLNNGRLEYIEIKANTKVSFASAKPTPTTDGSEVKVVGNNQFEIQKKDLIKYTSDLPSILMQARAVPATRPGTGEVYGYRLLEIQPGSIYTKLGLRPMDVICGVNGNPVTSIQQAMELYSGLQNTGGVELCVERDGKTQNMKYNIL